MRILVVAVGRLKPPFADDVQHYQRLMAGHARLELVEVKESEAVERRIPDRSYVSLLHRDGREMESEAFARWLEDRRMDGRDLCFVIGGPYGLELRPRRAPALVREAHAAVSAGACRVARAALPGAQDPGRRALPLLMGELELRHFARRIGLLFALIAGLLVFGTVGLSLSEGTNVWDSFVWALDIVATVGSIQAPTDVGGQIVKVVLIVLGVGTLFYALIAVTEFFVAGHLSGLLEDRRTRRMIDSLTDHYIVCGFGRVGRQVARDLGAAGAQVRRHRPRPGEPRARPGRGRALPRGPGPSRTSCCARPASSGRAGSWPAWTPTPRTSSSR